MSVIEGVGDEVLVCVLALSILLVIILAWFSTNVNDRPPISIIIVDRQGLQRLIQRITEFTRQRRDGTVPPNGTTTSNSTDSGNAPTEVPVTDTPSSGVENVTSPPDVPDSPESVGQGDTQPESVPRSNEGEGQDQPPESEDQTNQTTNVSPSSLPGAESLTDDQLRQARLSFFDKFGRGPLEGSETVSETNVTTAPSSNEQTTEESPSTDTTTPETGDPPSADTSNDGEIADEDCLDGHIRIRLKYLDDRNRWVQAKPDETIGDFKRRHFEGELSDNFVVRFIYNGQELRNPLDTLSKYSIIDKSVIHCLLSQAQPQPETNAQSPANEFDIGTLMFPLFGIILLLVWYFRFTYRSYFNAMSTFSLIGITLLFIVALLATWRTHDVHEHVE